MKMHPTSRGSLAIACLSTVFALSCITLKKPSYTLSGTVTDRDTGEPVQGCLVSAGELTDRTDVSGNYQIGDLPSGTVGISFETDDYQSFTTHINISEADKLYDVTLGHKTALLVVMVKCLKTGEGIIDATIQATNVQYPQIVRTANSTYQTDMNLRPGPWRFETTHPNHYDTTEIFDVPNILTYHTIYMRER